MSGLTRRELVAGAAAAILLPSAVRGGQATGVHFKVAEFDRARILRAADGYGAAPPLVLSAGPVRRQRFFCDAAIASGPQDTPGSTRDADLLADMTARIAACTAAWRLTGQAVYAERAWSQMRAWCLDPATRMIPTLDNEASATGAAPDLRTNPLRFTLCLAEFARAASFLCADPGAPAEDAAGVRAWAAELLQWFTTGERGIVARESTKADAIFWTMQASELARFVRDDAVWRECGHRFRDKLLRHLNLDGYFPYALMVRRPYAESMLLLECMASACESLSTPFESLWNASLQDGRSMRSAIAWALPYLQDRGKWPYLADVRHFSAQPVRVNALLFAGRAWNRQDDVDQWKSMTADTAIPELRREHPISQPALWALRPPA